VHGGFIAAAFDEVLGYVQSLGGAPGMTGTLEVRYLQPTPLGVPLRIEAELVRTEGRKIFAEGRFFAGERVTAEAKGIFISIPRERFEALLEARNARLAGE
jgi:acyl-coenzyme A thioesterase PaaI-like protein